jgi:hypothetical protein
MNKQKYSRKAVIEFHAKKGGFTMKFVRAAFKYFKTYGDPKIRRKVIQSLKE